MKFDELQIELVTLDPSSGKQFLRDSFSNIYEVKFTGWENVPIQVEFVENLNLPISPLEKELRRKL